MCFRGQQCLSLKYCAESSNQAMCYFQSSIWGVYILRAAVKMLALEQLRSQFKQKLRFVSKRASVNYRCLIFSSPVSKCLNIVNRNDTILSFKVLLFSGSVKRGFAVSELVKTDMIHSLLAMPSLLTITQNVLFYILAKSFGMHLKYSVLHLFLTDCVCWETW